MVIIAGESAWAWWCTPPSIRDFELTDSAYALMAAEHAAFLKSGIQQSGRKNASEAVHLVGGRLLGELKGVPLPVHVLVNRASGVHQNRLVHSRRIGKDIPRKHLHDLGGGLFVASPQLALVQMGFSLGFVRLLYRMHEACGLYTRFLATERAACTLHLLDASEIPTNYQSGVYAHCDLDGRRVRVPLAEHDACMWIPARGRNGTDISLWRRPPLICADDLVASLGELDGFRGARLARKAAQFVHDGSGSPLETSLLLFECLPPRYGGENWEAPLLNCQIPFDSQARLLTSARSCIADQLWKTSSTIIEVNGFAYHADRDGFWIRSGRTAALNSMGYTVIDINYAQMSNLEQLEVLLETIARKTGMKLQKRTRAFIEHRRILHDALFQFGEGEGLMI